MQRRWLAQNVRAAGYLGLSASPSVCRDSLHFVGTGNLLCERNVPIPKVRNSRVARRIEQRRAVSLSHTRTHANTRNSSPRSSKTNQQHELREHQDPLSHGSARPSCLYGSSRGERALADMEPVPAPHVRQMSPRGGAWHQLLVPAQPRARDAGGVAPCAEPLLRRTFVPLPEVQVRRLVRVAPTLSVRASVPATPGSTQCSSAGVDLASGTVFFPSLWR